ncbi:hypothetical protein MPSEU_000669300 [Mayamaea pseudoterrestris]|nr:hypothetical protein MPSEU_000669300 [Mayamaea pseudoterrestris]
MNEQTNLLRSTSRTKRRSYESSAAADETSSLVLANDLNGSPNYSTISRRRRPWYSRCNAPYATASTTALLLLAAFSIITLYYNIRANHHERSNLYDHHNRLQLYEQWQEWKQLSAAHLVDENSAAAGSSSSARQQKHSHHRHQQQQQQETEEKDSSSGSSFVSEELSTGDSTSDSSSDASSDSSSLTTQSPNDSSSSNQQHQAIVNHNSKHDDAPWQRVQTSVRSAPSAMQHSWEALVQQTHQVWVKSISSHENGGNSSNNQHHQWWKAAVESEEAWRSHLLHHLHRFGHHLQDWWSQNSNSNINDGNATTLAHDESSAKQYIQTNFESWWNHASQSEKAWWADTLDAYQHFTHAAGNQTSLWWELTQHAARQDWEMARTKAQVGSNWSQYQASRAYNWTKTEAAKDWNWTQQEASKDWNATTTYADNERNVWWSAMKSWFDEHYVSRNETLNVFYQNNPLLYLNNSVAYSLLTSNFGWMDRSHDFFAYQRGWDVQENQGFCGVASAVAVLNSLASNNIQLPLDPIYSPHPYATQQSILNNSCVNHHVVRYNDEFNGIFSMPGGLTLTQVAELLKCHLPKAAWQVKLRHLDETLSGEFVRAELIAALTNANARVLINFNRMTLNQEGYGHFSPIASYSSSQDAFLIMDMAKYKYPPVWVPTHRLVASMQGVDQCGDWDFPKAQWDLSDRYLHPTDVHDLHKAFKLLNCRPTNRGYVIVEMIEADVLAS